MPADRTVPPLTAVGRGPAVVVDAGIPFGTEFREDWYRVHRVEGGGWTRDALAGADAICVRSTTRVDAALLEGTPVRFVGTVTSGVDHLDLDYLHDAGIAVYHTPGANAVAVAEYVLANLVMLLPARAPTTLGVVGCGNVGTAVARRARLVGFEVVEHDPPRAARDPEFESVPLERVLAASVVTLHVPLTRSGPYPTADLIDARYLACLPSGAIFVNTARGGIVDEAALAARAEAGDLTAIVDCWRGEPLVDPRLLAAATVATPHLAGHTIDAKRRGARYIAHALDASFAPKAAAGVRVTRPAPHPGADVEGATYRRLLAEQVDFEAVTLQLKALAGAPEPARRTGFARLRADAGMRQELGVTFERGWRRGTPVADPHLPTGAVRIG